MAFNINQSNQSREEEHQEKQLLLLSRKRTTTLHNTYETSNLFGLYLLHEE